MKMLNILPKNIGLLVIIAALLLTLPNFAQSTITIINNDGAGEGFNDPTAFVPTGGNPATTLGAARLYAFQYAANLWAAHLNSNINIEVLAQFDPLNCTSNSAVLGSAGPSWINRDFTGAPVSNTWYPGALANALANADFSTSNEINATFNSELGNTGCLQNSGWYLGVDASPTGNLIDLVTVVFHEIGHGLGFSSFVNLGSGAKFFGYDDTYSRNLEHFNASPSDYPSMTDAQRVAASIADPFLYWDGANVNNAAPGQLTGGFDNGHTRMHGPNPQRPGSSVSHFSTALEPSELMEPSFTSADHTVGLALQLFQDIGWSVNNPAGDTSIPTATITESTTGTLMATFTDNLPLGIIEVKALTGNATLNIESETMVLNQRQSYGKPSINLTATGNSGDTIKLIITDLAGNKLVWFYEFL